MRYRSLGRTGLEVSEVGYGAWDICGSQWGGADDDESIAALRRAIDQRLHANAPADRVPRSTSRNRR